MNDTPHFSCSIRMPLVNSLHDLLESRSQARDLRVQMSRLFLPSVVKHRRRRMVEHKMPAKCKVEV